MDMLWRVRATLPDRPGSLAALAVGLGEAGVNIARLQIFPGADNVTDELILRVPEGSDAATVTAMLADAGAVGVVVQPCAEEALDDQPLRYVAAARTILDKPMAFPDIVARLFDAEADPLDPAGSADTMDLIVGDVQVQIHRTAPFTDTERARGAAIADLVNDVLARTRDAFPMEGSSGRRIGTGATPEYAVEGLTLSAYLDEVVVGQAVIADAEVEDGVRSVNLRVDPAWQRRRIGTRLLTDAARAAAGIGAEEILLTTRSDNQAVLPMVMAAGLRGRIKMAANVLTVRIPVRDLKPL